MYIPRTLLCVTVLLSALAATAQNPAKTYSDSTGNRVYTLKRNDHAVILYDTAYLLNKPTFALYRKYYESWITDRNSTRDLVFSFTSIIQKKDSLLDIRQNSYQQLKAEFDSLANKNLTFLNETDIKLKNASEHLTKATANLDSTKKLLQETQEQLKKEARKRNANALKFGLGGIVLGLVTGLLIAL